MARGHRCRSFDTNPPSRFERTIYNQLDRKDRKELVRLAGAHRFNEHLNDVFIQDTVACARVWAIKIPRRLRRYGAQ